MNKSILSNNIMKNILIIFLLVFCFLGFASCKDEPKEDPIQLKLVDNWKFDYRRSLVIMQMRANGSFEAQIREQNQFSKIVEKRGIQRGTWELIKKDKYIKFNVETSDEIEMLWEAGKSYEYLLAEITDFKLLLVKEDSGVSYEWHKLIKKGSAASKEDGPMIRSRTVPIAPIIVNLQKRSPYSKDRYLCAKFHISEQLEVPVLPEEMPPPIPVDPILRENIILYLSSFEYSQVNTFKEVKAIVQELQKMAAPYFGDRLNEFKLDNVIVAGTRGSLEEFIIQYPDQLNRFGLTPPEPPKKDKDKEGDGEGEESDEEENSKDKA